MNSILQSIPGAEAVMPILVPFLLAVLAGIALAIPVTILLIPFLEKADRVLKRAGVFSILSFFLGKSKKKDELPLAVKRALSLKNREQELPDWMQEWVSQVNDRLRKSGVGIPVGRYLLGTALGAAAGFIVGIWFLDNLGAAVVLCAAAFLVPDVIITAHAQHRKSKMIAQLGAAIRVFAAEFNDTPQVMRALNHTAQRIPLPLGEVLTRTTRQLAAGQSKDDILGGLMTELDFEYGRMFVQLLRLAWDDASVQPLFSRLATRVASMQSMMAKNSAGMAYSRVMALGVNALIIPVYFLVQWKIPGAREFMTVHPVGRLLVTVSFLSILLGLIMDRVLNGVKL